MKNMNVGFVLLPADAHNQHFETKAAERNPAIIIFTSI